jgi:NADH-quinone oxidoreductase subunit L
MGGLVRKMPRTSITFMIASLSIAGIFPLAGFWSKDEIVAATSGHPIFMIFTLLIAFMTAFYMWRLCFLTFFGQPRDSHRFEHAHESPGNMTWPLIVLAILSVGAGWVAIPGWFPGFVYHGEPYHVHWNIPLMGLSLLIGASGIYVAYLMYYKKSLSPEKVGQTFKPIYTFFYNKWYFDELYFAVLIRPAQRLADFLWKFDAGVVDGAVNGTAWLTIFWSDMKQLFDVYIIDGAVNGAGWTVRQWGNLLRFLQTGTVQFYALFIILMIVVLGISRVWTASIWPLLAVIFLSGAVLLGLLSRRSGSDDDSQALESEN